MNAIPDRQAFAQARLAEEVATARSVVERSRALLHSARGSARAPARMVLKKAQQTLTRLEHELRDEEQGEAAAPSVQRRELVDRGVLIGFEGEGAKRKKVFGDLVLREPRIEAAGCNARVVTPLDRMRSRGVIDLPLYKAGKAYLRAWETAHMDAYPVGLGGDGGRGEPSGGNRRIEQPVGSRAELQRMRSVIGSYGTGLLEHVIVHERDLDQWAGGARCANRHQAMGMLKMVLELLAGAEAK